MRTVTVAVASCLVGSRLTDCLHVAAQIKAHLLATSAAQHAYSLILVPRATALCRRILEDEGVLGDVQLVEYLLRWIPLEKDVLSLELRDAAREIFCVRPVFESSGSTVLH